MMSSQSTSLRMPYIGERRQLSILAAFVSVYLGCGMARICADPGDGLSALVGKWRENQSRLDDLRCESEYTLAVIRDEKDWQTGPYFSFDTARADSNPAAWSAAAEVCSTILWIKSGRIERFQERRYQKNVRDAVLKKGIRWTCSANADILFNEEIGIKVDEGLRGGGMWNDGVQLRSIQTPFDYLGSIGSDGMLTFDRLADRVGHGLEMQFRTEGMESRQRAIVLFTEGASADSIEYSLVPDEGCLPEKIVFRSSHSDGIENIIYIPERKQVSDGIWVPWQIIGVTRSSGQNGCQLQKLHVKSFEIGPRDPSEMSFQLPKMSAIHLGEQWDSQFVVDVDQEVGITRLYELISIAKRVAAGEPRGKFLNNPISTAGTQPLSAPLSSKRSIWKWLMFVKLFCVAGIVALWVIRHRR